MAASLTDVILEAADTAMPKLVPGAKAKPWWTDDLREVRKAMLRAQRLAIRNPSQENTNSYRSVKNSFFARAKDAKSSHWNAFLENETSSTIYKIMAYTKDSKVERIPQIRHLNNQY
ncbi:hypothetical protein MPH_13563 [Macrophomina phaseolina MS6]|uniref:Reverse transcriptase n=1 Tax=Macrophomina phaseolina (strain MS6) TaxID=1126212 RepID=K2R964_MACPH|nr:hypothetical protein MPH_13563 [Macrophomina phaseolina MS6]